MLFQAVVISKYHDKLHTNSSDLTRNFHLHMRFSSWLIVDRIHQWGGCNTNILKMTVFSLHDFHVMVNFWYLTFSCREIFSCLYLCIRHPNRKKPCQIGKYKLRLVQENFGITRDKNEMITVNTQTSPLFEWLSCAHIRIHAQNSFTLEI